MESPKVKNMMIETTNTMIADTNKSIEVNELSSNNSDTEAIRDFYKALYNSDQEKLRRLEHFKTKLERGDYD